MGRVSMGVPKGGLAGPLTAVATQLGVRSTTLTLGRVTSNGGPAHARFAVTDRLASGHVWHYQGLLHLVTRDRHWWVELEPGRHLPRAETGGAVHAHQRLAGPGSDTRRQRQRAELAGGDRPVRVA